MTVADVALELGVEYPRVYELIEAKKVYAQKVAGDIWLVPRLEVEAARRDHLAHAMIDRG